jgi:protein TonB
MHNERPFLGWALAISLALHAALLAIGLREAKLRVPLPAELTVRLPAPPAVAAAPETPQPVPRLTLPRPQPDAIATAPPAATSPRLAVRAAQPAAQPASAPQRLSGEAAMRAAEQLARELPYPPEAIERGLQGEALVMIFLDGSGSVVAARLEASSGHALLDDAAVRAARRLRALPDSAPREALLPVRFRLR